MPICHQITHNLISLLSKQLTRFGRFDAFRQHSPLMKPQDNGSSLVREESLSLQEFSFWKHPPHQAKDDFSRENVHCVYLAVAGEPSIYTLFCFSNRSRMVNQPNWSCRGGRWRPHHRVTGGTSRTRLRKLWQPSSYVMRSIKLMLIQTVLSSWHPAFATVHT